MNGKPADLNSVRNGIPLKSEMYVRRISFKDIPESEEESAKFIHNLYAEKVIRKKIRTLLHKFRLNVIHLGQNL